MRTLLFILSFLLMLRCGYNQDTTETNIFAGAIKNHATLWQNTISIKDYPLKTIIPLTMVTATSIIFDEPIHQHLHDFHQHHNLGQASQVITHFGDPYILGSATLLAYGSGWIFQDKKLRKTALMAAEAYIHNGIITYLGKLAFARQRPFVSQVDQWHFFPYSLNNPNPSSAAYQSFPSGHTSGIFTIATVFAQQYQDTKWVPLLAYTTASITGLSRITESKHWLSDVIIGAALGYGIGRFVVAQNRHTALTLLPAYWNHNVGLSMELKL